MIVARQRNSDAYHRRYSGVTQTGRIAQAMMKIPGSHVYSAIYGASDTLPVVLHA